MSRSRHKQRSRHLAASQRPPALVGPPRSRAREWAFRLVAMFVVPLVLLLGLEGGLRLAGCGYPTAFFKPMRIGAQDYLVDNDQFGLRFFPPALARIPSPVVMKAAKPAGTLRLFIFGESAALGDPRPHFGAGRYLEALLRERYPGQEFEVVNTAMTAINSHVIRLQARECARYQGDLWLIYMGNNEMVGPFGAATVFGRKAPPLWLVRATLALQQFRFCQLLSDLGRLWPSRSPSAWQGLEMFLENKVPPGDLHRQVVCRNFARNLQDILQAGLDAKAKVLLSTVAVNLKDCPPFASTEAAAGAAGLGVQAAAAEAAGNFAEAKRLYAQAATLGPDSADWQFRWGRSCLRANDPTARQHLQLAADLDALPFRADSRINELLRDAGHHLASSNLALCDAAALLAEGSPSGVPGQELFYEHVHLNFDGNYRLALVWAEALQKLLPPEVAARATASWASQEVCEGRLGLTDWNRLSVWEEIGRRLSGPPFTGQWDNAARLETARAQAEAIRQRRATAAREPARRLYAEALRQAPADPKLRENYAEFLEATRDTQAAIAERRRVCELIPHYYFPFFKLGELLQDQGQLSEALAALQQAAVLAPRSGEIRFQIGMVFARQGQWPQALAAFQSARRLGWAEPRLCLYCGDVLWKLNRAVESLAELRQAIRLQPGLWEAHYRLGDELAATGDIAEAAAEFEQVTRLNPGYVNARLNLGVALFKLGRYQEAAQRFDETLRLDPTNALALDFKRKAERQGGAPR